MRLSIFIAVYLFLTLPAQLVAAGGCDQCSELGITVNLHKEAEGEFKVITIDEWVAIASSKGGFAVHDESPYDATIGIRGKGKGIYYALLDSEKNIIGQVSDIDQDGFPDIKFVNTGKVEVFIKGGWREKLKDDGGSFILLDNKNKYYLNKDPLTGKYSINE